MRVSIGKRLYFGFLLVILFTIVAANLLSVAFRRTLAEGALAGFVVDVLSGTLSIAVGLALAWAISRSLIGELRSFATATKVISQGDLMKDVPVKSDDELGDLASAFNQMVGNLREIVKEVKATAEAVTTSALGHSTSAEEMNASTSEIASTMEQIAKGAEHQAHLVEQTSQVMRDMANSINEIAARARAAADAASEAGYTAQTGGKSAREAMGKMKELFAIIEASTLGVKGFSEKAQHIGSIVDVITRIAQQTHLLALNATIEAARAGEHGRGFAVVAEEIRKLATEAGASAEKIANIIKELQVENVKVLSSMEVATREINAGKEVLTFTGAALEDIVRVVLEEVKKVQEISALTQQQTRGAEELVKTIDEIAKVAQDNAASTEEISAATEEQTASMDQMATSAQELSSLSDRLRTLISRFKVGG
ncbi:MAG: methyl-accepting chemotaxis protein [candidate division NC10 bacterium]|nr:methyl-accepting chemotaxis protein [candidate division NC10 bacterium]